MNKKFLTLSLASLLSVGCYAQVKELKKNKDAVTFSKAINPTNAYKHLSILASDEFEGRETGKKGAWMAADYIRDYFKSIGLKGPVDGSYFQKIDLANYSITQSSLTINGQPKQLYTDYLITSNAVGLNGFTFSADDLVFAGYGINKDGYNDFEGLNLEGKVVVIFGSGDPTAKPEDKQDRRTMMMARARKVAFITKANAKAVIIIDPSLDNRAEQLKAIYGEGQPVMKSPEVVERMKSQNPFTTISVNTA
ncbi:MAG: peptidase, partial [Pedobacter sp.]